MKHLIDPATFTARYNAAWEALGNTEAEQAAAWFRTHYPDPWHVILQRRRNLDHDLHPRRRAA